MSHINDDIVPHPPPFVNTFARKKPEFPENSDPKRTFPIHNRVQIGKLSHTYYRSLPLCLEYDGTFHTFGEYSGIVRDGRDMRKESRILEIPGQRIRRDRIVT